MKNLSKIIFWLIFSVFLYNCIGYKNQTHKEQGGVSEPIMNIIKDFSHTYKTPKSYLKEREGKPFNVFTIWEEKPSNEKLYVFTVLPNNQEEIRLDPKDHIGKVPRIGFPNKYVVQEGKLFLWNDGTTPLQKEVLSMMDKYDVLDSIDVKFELGLLPINYEDKRMISIDDGLEAVDYYMCKNNITKYKRVTKNKAFGYYKPPKLKCSD